MKIVLIGAGSRSFGRGQIADVLQSRELRGLGVELHLVDVDAAALDVMGRVAERIRRHTGSDVRINCTTDRLQALPGAEYVIVSVACQRYPLWEQDFRVPLAHGFRHCLGENGGPGAVFHTMRSLRLVMPICRDVERLCPDALLLNFTNPEARVIHAILTLTRVRAAGLCHGVFSALEAIGRYAGKPIEDLEVVSAGMNHFYCILHAVDRATERDLLPELVGKAAEDASAPPLFRKMAEVFGVFTFPSDDHIGEYLSWGSDFHCVKWPYGQECRAVRPEEPPRGPSMEDYACGAAPVDAALLRPSGELAVPVIADIELNRGTRRPAVNVLNTSGFVSNLPRDAAVEVPAYVDAEGIQPQYVGPVPETFATMMHAQFTIQRLLTQAFAAAEAGRPGSRNLLLQALLLDPVVNSISEAEKLLDEMLALQKDYLPEFG